MTEEWCLMGPRHLDEMLRLVESFGVTGPGTDRHSVSSRWRQAYQEYERLAVSEAGAADRPQVKPLPKAMAAHVQRLIELPGVQRTFSTVPVAFGMVELEKLMVSQYSMTKAVVDHVRQAPATLRSAKRFAELCLPLAPIAANFKVAGRGKREFTFVADTHDMRFLGAKLLHPAQITDLDIRGQPQSVLALALGYSTNALNVVRFNDRLVLNNGHHRAFALRAMGVTHAPCLIQVCASSSDLQQVAMEEVVNEADLYFDAPRPPLLRDFANPALMQSYQAPRRWRQVTVKITVESQLLAL